MNQHVRTLLDQAHSPRDEVRKEAILHLALILELNAMPHESRTINREDYALTLSETFLDIELSAQERSEVVRELFDAFRTGPPTPTIFWAMSKSRVRQAFGLIVDLALSLGSGLHEELGYQAASALQRYTWKSDFVLQETEREKLLTFLEALGELKSTRVQEVIALIRADIERIEGSGPVE